MKQVITLIALTMALQANAQHELFFENQSNQSFTSTVEWIESTALEQNWKVIAVHNLQEAMEKAGHEVIPVKVFSICKPEIAVKILGKDDERIVSSMMPCRVSVYEKSDGKTYVSRINTISMAKAFTGEVAEVMVSTGHEIEELLAPLFDNSF